MTDKIIATVLRYIFSVPSFIIHVGFCASQYIFGISVNLITNVISWEAIFLSLLIGIQQIQHHEEHMDKEDK